MPMLVSSPGTLRVSPADGSKAIAGKTNHLHRPRGKFGMTPDPVFYPISRAKTGRPVQKMSYKPPKIGFFYFRESPAKPSRNCSDRSWATKTRPLTRFPVGGIAIRGLWGGGGTWDGWISVQKMSKNVLKMSKKCLKMSKKMSKLLDIF